MIEVAMYTNMMTIKIHPITIIRGNRTSTACVLIIYTIPVWCGRLVRLA